MTNTPRIHQIVVVVAASMALALGSFIVELPADRAAADTERIATPAATPIPPDAELDQAWRRLGCHLNPGNPSCLTVGLAADCAIDPADPGCGIDSDGDRCRDIAEVRAGFDPFDAADCVSTSLGEPAVNCLFLIEDIACDGRREATSDENECVAARDIRLRRDPSSLFGCDDLATPPPSDCPLFTRDPGCDGFAPGES